MRRLVATYRAGEADSLTREEVADLIEVWAGVRDAAAGRAPMRGSFPYTAGYQLAREFAPAPPLRGPAAAMPIPQLTPAECHRLLSRIRITDGCWVWTGRTVSVGYGALTIGGRQTLAHRAMWRLLRGETPGQLRNTCGNRLCCRPDHMVSSTPSSEGRRLDPAVADLVASFLRQEGAE